MIVRRIVAARAALPETRAPRPPRGPGAPRSLRVLGVLAGLACSANGVVAQDLANPFALPKSARASASPSVGAEAPLPPLALELRATLVIGRESSANIGGTIVRVGEKIRGYRLVSVHEGAAVLVDAAGITHVLGIERHEFETPWQVTP